MSETMGLGAAVLLPFAAIWLFAVIFGDASDSWGTAVQKGALVALGVTVIVFVSLAAMWVTGSIVQIVWSVLQGARG